MLSVVIPILLLDLELVQQTRDCLYSLKGQFDELIIIDDASPLPAGEFKLLSTTYFKNEKRLGYIRSANLGIKKAKGKHVVIVCNDTKMLSGKLEDLCREGFMFPEIVGKKEPFWDGSFYGFPREIGLYDERYDNYFGDLDKFYNAKKKGILLSKTNSVKVHHKESQTTNKLGIRNQSYEKDLQTFKDKWGFDPFINYLHLI